MTESAREKATRERRMYCDSANEMLALLDDLCAQWEVDLVLGGAALNDLNEVRHHAAKAQEAVARLVPLEGK
jgi:hypothetical protein